VAPSSLSQQLWLKLLDVAWEASTTGAALLETSTTLKMPLLISAVHMVSPRTYRSCT
jgi:hypothetical protein